MNHFFDSHCHFDFDHFDKDRSAVWQQAQALGLQGVLIPGVTPSQWPQAQLLSQQLQGGLYAIGLHPWWLNAYLSQSECDKNDWAINDWAAHLVQCMAPFAKDQHCKAIGETGLDACMPPSKQVSLDKQQAMVSAHLRCANHFKMPVILHCRKAHNELLACLDQVKPVAGGVLHGFTGSTQLAQNYWRRGLRIGVGGSITYPRANKTRQAIQALPDEALVLETDAPDMPLSGKQGQRNSPEYVPQIAQALAALRGQALDCVAQYTLYNSRKLFDF
ncbi:TatD family hydrolase [Marinagarivorans algicola]|uniref:TatD family hydrolase n=1 Tax=Marinagarivorans algicola TaxID=1513270 RepID=UPI0006B503B1|nr:TatD family hydrolase [Marinagarivorans algicola]